MCLILDKNIYGNYLNPDGDQGIILIQKWVHDDKVRIVYSNEGELGKELPKGERMHTMLTRLRGNDRARVVDGPEINDLMDALKPLERKRKLKGKVKPVKHGPYSVEPLLSDDSHVIALALVAKVKLLVSEDGELGTDFKRELRGKVYKISDYESVHKSKIKKINEIKEKHRKLLIKAQCNTAPCGMG